MCSEGHLFLRKLTHGVSLPLSPSSSDLRQGQ